jgi:hypothetical protein
MIRSSIVSTYAFNEIGPLILVATPLKSNSSFFIYKKLLQLRFPLYFDLLAARAAFGSSPDSILSAPIAAPLVGQPVFRDRNIEQLLNKPITHKQIKIFFIV